MRNDPKVDPAPIWTAIHDAACDQKLDFYTDPVSGLLVSTRYQHLNRGSCCGSGCRHCPYVSQPKSKIEPAD